MSIISKSAIAGIILVSSPASIAGPFVNAETNASYFGDARESTVTDVHFGYDFPLSDKATLTLQGGPAFVSIPDTDVEHEMSGKIALSVDATDKLNVYGEVSAITIQRDIEADFPVGLKAGVKYSF
tara:strand:- start:282 stop:659 length:378 start_codon:yes stop_codon:yes gene_type:complete